MSKKRTKRKVITFTIYHQVVRLANGNGHSLNDTNGRHLIEQPSCYHIAIFEIPAFNSNFDCNINLHWASILQYLCTT